MDRREFSAAAALAVAAGAIGLPNAAWAQKKPEDGTDYRTLDKRAPVDAQPPKIEVIEFFWYSCPHCNAFEPKLEVWEKRKPADIVLKRVPVAFRDDFEPQQRLFYALEAMGKVDALQAKVFQAIHQEHQKLDKGPEIIAWVGKQGVDTQKFSELYNSFAIATKARRATQLQNDFYKVEGVPAMGIAGRWYTDGTMAGNMDRCLQIVEYLVAEARKSK